MPVIDLGKVVGDPGASMRFRGEWNGGSEYFNNESYIDTVTHHGSLWVCKQTNTGQEPIEGDYWGIGAQGNSDLNASDVTYDNESSGLSSNTAQGAIDEIVEIEKVVNGNQADLYSPDETYTAGRLVINNNALWKAKQDINVAEPWTPAHWTQTTVAAELSSLNSRGAVISASKATQAVYAQDYPVVSINLEAGHTYLVLAHIVSDKNSDSPLLCSIKSESGASQFGGGSNISIMQNGGGTTAYAIVTCDSDAICSLYSYGYLAEPYNVTGDMVAIQLR